MVWGAWGAGCAVSGPGIGKETALLVSKALETDSPAIRNCAFISTLPIVIILIVPKPIMAAVLLLHRRGWGSVVGRKSLLRQTHDDNRPCAPAGLLRWCDFTDHSHSLAAGTRPHTHTNIVVARGGRVAPKTFRLLPLRRHSPFRLYR